MIHRRFQAGQVQPDRSTVSGHRSLSGLQPHFAPVPAPGWTGWQLANKMCSTSSQGD